ncbi:MAG: exopolysaccharide biosynthesis protein [Alphaproteobacteria bacterium]
MTIPSAHDRPPRISDVMRGLMESASTESSVTIGHILQAFGVRGFAFLFLMLSLLNIVIFMVPLISILFGLPMVILAVQIVLGLRAPIFPLLIRKQSIHREALMQGLARSIYGVQKIERYIKPRLMFLTHPVLDRVHGIATLMMAAMVSMPIPVFNVPPSIAIMFIALGLLERDGIFIIIGYGIGFWCLWLFQSIGHYAHTLTGG